MPASSSTICPGRRYAVIRYSPFGKLSPRMVAALTKPGVELLALAGGQEDLYESLGTAHGEAHVTVIFDDRPYTGIGASTDIIEAAVLAYLNAMNKYLAISGEG